MPSIADNLRSIRARIARACAVSGRDPAEVTLVAVTKSVDVALVEVLHDLGVRDFGENRPQALLARREELEQRVGPGSGVRWHLIGHLQRNKVRSVLPATALIHSIDSRRLLDTVDAEARRRGGDPARVLLEVNVSGETSKHGLSPDEVAPLLEHAAGLAGVAVDGLMCMAPYEAEPRELRSVFRRLRELRDEPASRRYLGGGGLSMGMSGDFDIAVEEGASLVRVGRALFESH